MSDNLPQVFTDAAPQRIIHRRSEGTAVEQSRAVAEVQAAIVVAQQRPRDKSAAMAEMREVTGMKELAERAFFSFNRGGQVNGASIHLARELARCWGNINYGVTELGRDDAGGQSEMLAFAWDLEANTRRFTSFIVPHVRDTKNGSKLLTDQRDIYENNANNGARRLRECIFSVLPVWFVEEAKARCTHTVREGGGVPLIKRVADTIAAYGDIGVTKPQLEARQGRKSDQWTADDYASLRVLYGTIKNGETSVAEEFPKGDQPLPENADAFERAAAGQQGQQTQQGGGEAAKRRPGRPRKADAPAAPTPEPTATTFQIVDSNGEIGQFPDEESAIQALRGLLNGAATEAEVIAIRNANGSTLGAHPDLAQTAQNRLNGFAAERAAAEQSRQAAAEHLRNNPPAEHAENDGADASTAAGGLSIILKTRGVAETEDGQYQYDLPDQAEDYEADFAVTFRAHAAARDVLAFNAAVKEHEPEVARIRDDGRFADLWGRLVKLITECHGLLRKPRPVSTSDMH